VHALRTPPLPCLDPPPPRRTTATNQRLLLVSFRSTQHR
jgi:hypothetical protein